MANEVVPSGIANLMASEEVATEFLYLLADRDGSVLTHPALMHATGRGSSNVVEVPHIGLMGYNLLSATTPGSQIANTALSDGATDVTVASRAKIYTMDDLARFILGDKVDAQMFAQDAAISVAMTLVSLVANVTDGFAATAGSTGVDASWNDIIDAKSTLGIAKASGEILAILHPRQWGDLEIDSLSLGAAPAAGGMGGVINTGLGGLYKGRWMGIDFYVSSEVPTANAGADRAGGIFTRGAVAWADREIPAEADPNILNLGRARFERVRRGDYLTTGFATSWHAGVALAIDAAGVSLITDA